MIICHTTQITERGGFCGNVLVHISFIHVHVCVQQKFMCCQLYNYSLRVRQLCAMCTYEYLHCKVCKVCGNCVCTAKFPIMHWGLTRCVLPAPYALKETWHWVLANLSQVPTFNFVQTDDSTPWILKLWTNPSCSTPRWVQVQVLELLELAPFLTIHSLSRWCRAKPINSGYFGSYMTVRDTWMNKDNEYH